MFLASQKLKGFHNVGQHTGVFMMWPRSVWNLSLDSLIFSPVIEPIRCSFKVVFLFFFKVQMSSLLQLHSLSGKLFVPLFILSQNNVIVDCCLLGACYFQVLLCSGFAWVLEKLGKSWHFILTFSKTGKSWEKTTSPGKSWKSALLKQ